MLLRVPEQRCNLRKSCREKARRDMFGGKVNCHRNFTVIAVTLAALGCDMPDYRDVQVQEICSDLGRALTDEERIIKALEYHYESDEILLRDFPKGTKASDEAEPRTVSIRQSQGSPSSTPNPKPPFVPLHFQTYKRTMQAKQRTPSVSDIIKAYYHDFPGCCEVVEPQWKREKWDGLHLELYGRMNHKTDWNRDVWVRSIYPFRTIADEREYSRKKESRLSQPEYIQRRGERGIGACGNPHENDRGYGS